MSSLLCIAEKPDVIIFDLVIYPINKCKYYLPKFRAYHQRHDIGKSENDALGGAPGR